jgi:hypothetical protein
VNLLARMRVPRDFITAASVCLRRSALQRFSIAMASALNLTSGTQAENAFAGDSGFQKMTHHLE